jgi:hypothetical protein
MDSDSSTPSLQSEHLKQAVASADQEVGGGERLGVFTLPLVLQAQLRMALTQEGEAAEAGKEKLKVTPFLDAEAGFAPRSAARDSSGVKTVLSFSGVEPLAAEEANDAAKKPAALPSSQRAGDPEDDVEAAAAADASKGSKPPGADANGPGAAAALAASTKKLQPHFANTLSQKPPAAPSSPSITGHSLRSHDTLVVGDVPPPSALDLQTKIMEVEKIFFNCGGTAPDVRFVSSPTDCTHAIINLRFATGADVTLSWGKDGLYFNYYKVDGAFDPEDKVLFLFNLTVDLFGSCTFTGPFLRQHGPVSGERMERLRRPLQVQEKSRALLPVGLLFRLAAPQLGWFFQAGTPQDAQLCCVCCRMLR